MSSPHLRGITIIMRAVIFEALFVLASSTITFRRHVFVSQAKTWHEAQKFCREHYYDLSTISLEWGQEPLRAETSGKVAGRFWIGLYVNGSEWWWSGVGPAGKITWDKNEPTDPTFSAGSACWDCGWSGLRDASFSNLYPFFCARLQVVTRRRLSWERALHHCAQTRTSLLSVSSEAEQQMAMWTVEHSGLDEPVWIGMRFLVDRWMWVDGSARQFEEWDPSATERDCPARKSCGALSAEGPWENRDCEEELFFICV